MKCYHSAEDFSAKERFTPISVALMRYVEWEKR